MPSDALRCFCAALSRSNISTSFTVLALAYLQNKQINKQKAKATPGCVRRHYNRSTCPYPLKKGKKMESKIQKKGPCADDTPLDSQTADKPNSFTARHSANRYYYILLTVPYRVPPCRTHAALLILQQTTQPAVSRRQQGTKNQMRATKLLATRACCLVCAVGALTSLSSVGCSATFRDVARESSTASRVVTSWNPRTLRHESYTIIDYYYTMADDIIVYY